MAAAKAWRRAAVRRAKGLPGPPGLPGAKRPWVSREACLGPGAAARSGGVPLFDAGSWILGELDMRGLRDRKDGEGNGSVRQCPLRGGPTGRTRELQEGRRSLPVEMVLSSLLLYPMAGL